MIFIQMFWQHCAPKNKERKNLLQLHRTSAAVGIVNAMFCVVLVLSANQEKVREDLGREKEEEEGVPLRLMACRPCNTLNSNEHDNHLSIIASNRTAVAIYPLSLSLSFSFSLSLSVSLPYYSL